MMKGNDHAISNYLNRGSCRKVMVFTLNNRFLTVIYFLELTEAEYIEFGIIFSIIKKSHYTLHNIKTKMNEDL